MKTRHGFTLIEMLVATALTLFLMVIISEAFVTALDTFSSLKSLGDMEEGLRTATMNLRYDLQQQHFEGTRRLSDSNITFVPIREGFFAVRQVQNSIFEGTDNDAGVVSGLTGLQSFLAPNHMLHFTVRLRGNSLQNYYSAQVPPDIFSQLPNQPLAPPMQPTPGGYPSGWAPWQLSPQLGPLGIDPLLTNYTLAYNTAKGLTTPANLFPNPPNFFGQAQDASFQSGAQFNSQWAEVAYFLAPQGTTLAPHTPGASGGTQLFGLYRSQLVVAPANTALNFPINQYPAPAFIPPVPQSAQTVATQFNTQYQNVACNPDPNFYPNPNSYNSPPNPPGYTPMYFYTPNDLANAPTLTPLPGPPPGYQLRFMRTLDRLFSSTTSVSLASPLPGPNVVPGYAFAPTQFDPETARGTNLASYGATLVLNNVVSFNVRLLQSRGTNFSPLLVSNEFSDLNATAFNATTGSAAAGYVPATYPQPVFDTSASTDPTASGARYFSLTVGGQTINVPYAVCFPVSAVQMSIRIWDQKTQQSRQITIIQDM